MKKILFFVPIIFMLAACGDNSKIKDVVRQNLKDPGSAQFKDATISADGERACMVWNAKNSMGGYGDWDVAELQKENSIWVVKDMEGNMDNCSQIGFKALDARGKAELDAQLEAIELLKNAKKISIEEAIELALNGECRNLVYDYSYASKHVAEDRVRLAGDDLAPYQIDTLRSYEKDLNEAHDKLSFGDCQKKIRTWSDM